MSVLLIIVLALLAIVVLFVLGVGGYALATYNSLVTLRNRVRNAWSQIDVQLQRRLDLIPNLVETVKGYAKHESGTLEAVVQARAAVTQAGTPGERMEADNQLTSTLKTLFAVAEAYPDLKANQSFQQLQSELADTEDKVSHMRLSYNDVVMRYNTRIQQFPAVIIARIFGFTQEKGFEADAGASTAPRVSF